MIAAGDLDVDGTHAHLNSTLQTYRPGEVL
jgi:hypothetical protein